MSNGIKGHGTTLSGVTTGSVGEITRINLGGMEADSLDVSTMTSPNAVKEFIAGMKDPKDIQLELLYEQGNMHTLLEAVGGDNEDWTITFPDGSTFVCEGFVQSLGTQIPMGDKIQQTCTIKLSGEPVFTEGS